MLERTDDNVVLLSDYKPHLSICTSEDAHHILPVSLLEEIAKKERPLSALDEYEEILPRIIEEWLNSVYLDEFSD